MSTFARLEDDGLAIYGPSGRAWIPLGDHGSAWSVDDVTAALQPAECEGYSNYPTFSVGVVMRNDRVTVERWRNQARGALAKADAEPSLSFTRRELAQIELAEWLKIHAETQAPDLDGFYSSLLSHGMSCVDWHELAGEWLDDAEGVE